MVAAGDISGLHPSPASPLVNWHEQDDCSHVVQLYSSDDYLTDGVSRFIGTALGSGGSGVIVATPEHEAAIQAGLRRRGFDLHSPALRSRCLFLDAAETLSRFMTRDVPDKAGFNAVVGEVIAGARKACGDNAPLAVFGEMVAILWAEGKAEAAIQLEQLWNELAETQIFSLRCAYPMSGFNEEQHAEQFLRICTAHSGIIPGESYSALNSDEERLRNIGFLQQRAQALEKEKSERRQAEHSLHLREAELADLLENAVEGVQRVGPDHKILWANRALLDLLGYNLSEHTGRPLADLFVHRKNFEDYWARLMAREDVRNFPAELRCKDGSTRHVLIHSNGLWDQGGFVHTRCFIRDITDQRNAEMALRESEARLRKTNDDLERIVQQRTLALRRLSSQVIGLQDAERRRVARELHDSLGQYLAVLKLNIEMLRENPTSSELWAESEKLTERCISEMRTLSYLLHPPMIDEAGLGSAARWYIDGFSERSHTKATLEVSDNLGRLPDHMELALFRILQEALTNVHRHAKASAIAVRILRENEQVILEIQDNGQGIKPEVLQRFRESGAGTGVGLTGMRERVRELGGKLMLDSTGVGTLVRVSIPLRARRSQSLRTLSPAAADD